METKDGVIQLIPATKSEFSGHRKIYRDGIELEKGVVISKEFLERNEKLLEQYIQYFCAYPDLFLDLITPTDSNFTLFPFQRIFLRACMRYRDIYITAARATSKTFLAITAKLIQCILIPKHRGFIVAPNKNQAAKISKQKIKEIFSIYPLLEGEVKKFNSGTDYVEITFKNDSVFSIVGAIDSDRGLRNHSGLIDEARKLVSIL